MTGYFIDMGRDYRLADDPHTRVTQAQVDAINDLADVDSMGADDPRYGEMTGPIIVFHTDGRTTEVAENGDSEEIERWR